MKTCDRSHQSGRVVVGISHRGGVAWGCSHLDEKEGEDAIEGLFLLEGADGPEGRVDDTPVGEEEKHAEAVDDRQGHVRRRLHHLQ
jgi:hypothetical protein